MPEGQPRVYRCNIGPARLSTNRQIYIAATSINAPNKKPAKGEWGTKGVLFGEINQLN